MIRNTKTIFAVFAALCLSAQLFAQLYFVGNSDKNPLAYKCGEEMVFSISLFDGDKIKTGQKLIWHISGDDGQAPQSGTAISGKNPLALTAKCNKPGFVRVRVFAVDDNGKKIDSKLIKQWGNTTTVDFQGGAGAEIEKIENSGKAPEDFDAFWQRQLAAQSKIEPKHTIKKLPEFSKGNFEAYLLNIDCLGKPAKAFITIPKNAKQKSLPLIALFHGYGVSRINPTFSENAITLSVLRHSYDALKDDAYYKAKANGELKGFGLSASENKNPENCYFKFMVMRDLRALEYAKKNIAEWNGKDLTVKGGSMGGFQALFVAALDKDVSLCCADIPWMTDLWASDCDSARQPCEFKPQWTPQIRYFDATFAAKRIKCPVQIRAWLGDYTCPPAGVMVLYNNISSAASIDFGQNGTHSGTRTKPEKSKHFSLKKNF